MQGSLVGNYFMGIDIEYEYCFLGSAEGAVDPFGPLGFWCHALCSTLLLPSLQHDAVCFGSLFLSLSLSLVNGLSLLPPVGAPLCDLPRPCFSLIFAVQMSRAICVIMYSHCIYLELPPNPCFFLKSELHLEDHKDSSALSIVLEMKRGSVETLKLPVIVNSLIFQVDTDQSHRKQKLMQEYPSP